MSFRRHLESFRQDIYAAYCEKNVTEVRLVLNYLRADGLKVYDPALERVPGKFICVRGRGRGRGRVGMRAILMGQDAVYILTDFNYAIPTSIYNFQKTYVCKISLLR